MESSNMHPVDRGWAWVVAIAGMALCWMVIGVSKLTGVILVEVESLFNATALELASIVSIKSIVSSISSLFMLGIVSDLLHLRILIIGGSVVICFAYSVCFTAQNIHLMYLHSALSGIGVSMLWAPCMVMIGQYFRKRHSIANAIVTSGVSFGTITLPHFLKFLLDSYGFNGAMLIVGGMLLHVTLFGSLMRPPEYYYRYSRDEEMEEQGSDVTFREMEIEVQREKGQSLDNIGERCHSEVLEVTDVNEYDKKPLPKKPDIELDRGDRDCDHRLVLLRDTDISQSNPDICQKKILSAKPRYLSPVCDNDSARSSLLSIYSTNIEELPGTIKPEMCMQQENETETTPDKQRSEYHFFLRSRDKNKKLRIIHLDLLKNIPFVTFVLGSSMYFASMTLNLPFLAPYAKESVESLDDITVMISVYGGSELIGRYLFGFLGDSGWVKPHKLLAFVCFINGVILNVLRLFQGFVPLTIYHVIAGGLESCYGVITPVVIVEFFGHEIHARSWGITLLLRGFISFGLAQTVGYIRTQTGSYASAYNLLGSVMIASSAVWILVTVPLLKKQQQQKEEVVEDTQIT